MVDGDKYRRLRLARLEDRLQIQRREHRCNVDQRDSSVDPEQHADRGHQPRASVRDTKPLHAHYYCGGGEPEGADEEALGRCCDGLLEHAGVQDEACGHHRAETQEEHEIQDEEGHADSLQSVELVWRLGEQDGYRAC